MHEQLYNNNTYTIWILSLVKTLLVHIILKLKISDAHYRTIQTIDSHSITIKIVWTHSIVL